ncbi:MAG TPA: hypothetical protein VNK04_09955 [Gemmataceae bacterium]|jgi:hypothetical protein|nr:hypothetical protein [Gemmataceae bacterium]
MIRWMIASAGLLVLSVGGAMAADGPVGVWTRTVGDRSIKFDIQADRLKVTLAEGTDRSIVIDASYTIKEGVLSGVIKKVELKGVDGGPSEGSKFSFRIKVDKDRMTLSELKGDDGTAVNDEAKQLVEGEYKKEK